MIQVESLRRCPVRTVGLASGWTRSQVFIRRFLHFHSVPLVGSFEEADSSGIYQVTRYLPSSMVEKKFLLVSRRADWGFRFKGSAALLVF
jgi:hypothetical protein